MNTVTVEVKNNVALQILKNLESADLIHIIEVQQDKKSVLESIKLLKGSISSEKSTQLLEELAETRQSWELRTI
jgi:hypothetical protein